MIDDASLKVEVFGIGFKCVFVIKGVLEVLSKLLGVGVFIGLWGCDVDHGGFLKVCLDKCFSNKMGDGPRAAEALDAKVVGKALVCCELFCCFFNIGINNIF